jgi:hypothetical protein
MTYACAPGKDPARSVPPAPDREGEVAATHGERRGSPSAPSPSPDLDTARSIERAIAALGRAREIAAATARDPAAAAAARRVAGEPKRLCCADIDHKTILPQLPHPGRPNPDGPSLVDRLAGGAGEARTDDAKTLMKKGE